MNSSKVKSVFGIVTCALALSAGAADVRMPKIKPQWSGAKVASWTMDYEEALRRASESGKYTLVMFSGMWWCPHCQFLEENVLTTSAWKKFAQGNGFYETVLDFPNRAGTGYWCWLWDGSFRKTARLTAEEAAAELALRYDVQDAFSLPGSTHQIAANEVVEIVGIGRNVVTNRTPFAAKPVSEYNRVGYPTVVVVAPDCSEAGRFSPDKGNADFVADPVGWVKGQVNAILHPGAGEPLASAAQYDGFVLSDDGKAMAGTVAVKTGKPNRDTNLAAVSLTFTFADGKRQVSKTSVFAAENVRTSFVDASGNEIEFVIGSSRIAGRINGQAFSTWRNVFATREPEAQEALDAVKGSWTLVVDGAFGYARGCMACGTYSEGIAPRALLTLAVSGGGKVRVSGVTAGGTKVSATAQLAYGDGLYEIPVMDKKSGICFVLRIDAAGGGSSLDFARSGETLVAFARPAATLPGTMYYVGDEGVALKLTAERGRLSATEYGFSLRYVPTNGSAKGSYRRADGKTVAVEGLFAGAEGYLFSKVKSSDAALARVSVVAPEDFGDESGGSKDPSDDCGDCHE